MTWFLLCLLHLSLLVLFFSVGGTLVVMRWSLYPVFLCGLVEVVDLSFSMWLQRSDGLLFLSCLSKVIVRVYLVVVVSLFIYAVPASYSLTCLKALDIEFMYNLRPSSVSGCTPSDISSRLAIPSPACLQVCSRSMGTIPCTTSSL